jgi:hypothetical protein
MITTENYFKKIKTPICKNGSHYHIIISFNGKKEHFEGNFLSGLSSLYYKKNFKAKTLNRLLQKIYNYRKDLKV